MDVRLVAIMVIRKWKVKGPGKLKVQSRRVLASKVMHEARRTVRNQVKEVAYSSSLKVQWLRLQASNAEGLGSIPDQGTRSYMQQLKDPTCYNEDQVQSNT